MDVRFPIGVLQVPDQVTSEIVKDWLEKIGSFPSRLRELVDGLSNEELSKTYREGAWTVRQLVHHIADAQLHMYQRLKLAVTEDNPAVSIFNEEIWAVLPDTELPVESSIKMIEGINERIVSLVETFTEQHLARTFLHPENGQLNVIAKLAKLAWHEEHHLTHIKLALSN